MREPILRAAIKAMAPPAGSVGLDVGCGIGTFTLLLAEKVGHAGHVTGLDISPEFLDRARVLAHRSDLSERVDFLKGNANHLPFDDDSFDWAVSVDCVGYGTSNSASLIREMARVVRRGGFVAIQAWSSERLLPGYPLLEARLGATSAGLAPFGGAMSPDEHLARGLGWFRTSGLHEPSARALAGSVCAPLSSEIRNALSALFEMRWPGAELELDHHDRLEFNRLCDPHSPDFILDHPDYFAYFTYSLFRGRVPG